MKITAAFLRLLFCFILYHCFVKSSKPRIPKASLHKLLATNRDHLVKIFDVDSPIAVPEYEIVKFSLSSRSSRSISSKERQITFNAFNQDFHLRLHPKEDVVSPSLVLMQHTAQGWRKQMYSPKGTFLHGYLTHHTHSYVAMRELSHGQLSGTIINGKHEYKVEPVPHHIKTQMSLDSGEAHHVVSRKMLRARNYARPIPVKSEEHTSKLKPRRTRRSMGPKYIEAMMTLDKVAVDYYGKQSMDYVLAVANMVNRLYADKSIGFDCSFMLTKVFLIEKDVPELNIAKNAIDSASRYLDVFSKWYFNLNTPAGSAEHFDNGVLLTRKICGIKSCSLDGLAYYNIPCNLRFGASINDAHGIATAFSVAHEMGHNFGADHDTGACKGGYIMNAGQANGANAFKWSKCSKDVLMDKFSNVKCYDNKPPKHIPLPSIPPGYKYNGDKQCKFLYGEKYSLCPITTENCGTLFCYHGGVCISSRGGPPVDGTPCGDRKWCVSGRCEGVGSSLPPRVDGGWGTWGAYSSCSRTCGGGVRHRLRPCNNPSPKYGGKPCPGSAKGEWVICNKQACPSGSQDYRTWQCKQKSSTFDRHYIGSSRCDLYCCRGGLCGGEGLVAAGTKYDESDPDFRDICIEGQRALVGCDDVIGSGNVWDRCRKCKGDGSTCVRKIFEFTEDHRGYGPDKAKQMTVLPVGVTDCDINENNATKNLVNIRLTTSSALLFRARPVTSTVKAAGTIIEYYIGDLLHAERMYIRGPTTKALAPMFVYVGDKNVGYTIKYCIPGQAQRTAFHWKTNLNGDCSKSCAGGYRPQFVTCHRGDDESRVSSSFCDAGDKPPDMATCNLDPCPASWKPEPWSICSRRCAGGNMTRLVPCVQRVTQDIERGVEYRYCEGQKRPPFTSTCNQIDCDPAWEVGKWSRCGGAAIGSPGIATREVTCRQRLANGSFPLVPPEVCAGFSTRTYETAMNCTVVAGGMPLTQTNAFHMWWSTLLSVVVLALLVRI